MKLHQTLSVHWQLNERDIGDEIQNRAAHCVNLSVWAVCLASHPNPNILEVVSYTT